MAEAPKNLTGVPKQPSIWSDLGLDTQEKELSAEEKLRRKRALAASRDLLPVDRPVRGYDLTADRPPMGFGSIYNR